MNDEQPDRVSDEKQAEKRVVRCPHCGEELRALTENSLRCAMCGQIATPDFSYFKDPRRQRPL